MTPRKTALVWRLAIPVVLAILPLAVGAQSGMTQSPDDILKQETYQTPPRDLAGSMSTVRRALHDLILEAQSRQARRARAATRSR